MAGTDRAEPVVSESAPIGEWQERFDKLVSEGRGSTPEAFALAHLLVLHMPDEDDDA